MNIVRVDSYGNVTGLICQMPKDKDWAGSTDNAHVIVKQHNETNRAETSSYADAEATLKHIILGGIADGHPKPEKQVDAIAENLFKPETLWCIKMLLQRHSA